MVILDNLVPKDLWEIRDLQVQLEKGDRLDSLDLLVLLEIEDFPDRQVTKDLLVCQEIQVILASLDSWVNQGIEDLKVFQV